MLVSVYVWVVYQGSKNGLHLFMVMISSRPEARSLCYKRFAQSTGLLKPLLKEDMHASFEFVKPVPSATNRIRSDATVRCTRTCPIKCLSSEISNASIHNGQKLSGVMVRGTVVKKTKSRFPV